MSPFSLQSLQSLPCAPSPTPTSPQPPPPHHLKSMPFLLVKKRSPRTAKLEPLWTSPLDSLSVLRRYSLWQTYLLTNEWNSYLLIFQSPVCFIPLSEDYCMENPFAFDDWFRGDPLTIPRFVAVEGWMMCVLQNTLGEHSATITILLTSFGSYLLTVGFFLLSFLFLVRFKLGSK